MFAAHIREDGTCQTVLDHLEATRKMAVHFAESFGAQNDAEQAAMLHDIGKYSSYFQQRIRDPQKYPPHDHATAGAREVGRISPVSFAIAGHHGGIPDGGSRADSSGCPTLMGRLKKTVDNYDLWNTEQTPRQGNPPVFCTGADPFTMSFYTRMLYSCLVDADYLDTEHFMTGDKPRGEYDSIPDLLQKLENYIKGWSKVSSALNTLREEIRQSCIEAGKGDRGLYTLTVPTGGGKTLSSLFFALNHAKQHRMSRIIYIIPYTSIIDQTAQIFRNILGEDQVVEHHSGVEYNEEALTPSQYKKLLSTENWDAPIIVTTAVQFFESLFSNRSSRCRKLHNITNAVLIFDEAQTIPVPYLLPCVAAMSQLINHYHATAVLCTATQPMLEPFFAEHGLIARDICKDTSGLYTALRRTTLCPLNDLTDEDLGQRLAAHRQVLCIVNRRKQAQQLFADLPREGSYCLTTLLYPQHRKKLLEEIRLRLNNNLPCRVISTSLIEAGVDVDFPVVYREEAGLDSIIQAAGRCNREGKEPAEKSFVYIFRTQAAVPPMIRQNVDATRSVLSRFRDPASPEAIAAYFEFFHRLRGKQAMDQKGILDAFTRGIDGCLFPFAQVSERFRLIDSPVKTVYIPLDHGAPLVEQLRKGDVSKSLFRTLNQYSVSVYPDHFQALQDAGALELLDSGDGILCDLRLYDDQTGLCLDVTGSQGWFL